MNKALTFALACILNGLSYAQAPPPVVSNSPTGGYMLRLQIDASVEDVSGNPYSGTLTLSASDPANGFCCYGEAVANASGDLTGYVYVPIDVAFDPMVIGLWENGAALRESGPARTFLNAQDGRGSLHRATPTGSYSSGAAATITRAIVATPPKAGTVNLSRPSLAGESFAIDAGRADRWDPGFIGMPWVETLPTGTQSIDFYTWSYTPYWDFALYDPEGILIGGDYYRQGQGFANYAVPNYFKINCTVDLTLNPGARRIYLVDAQQHSPSSTDPTGSNIPLSEIASESLAACSVTTQGAQVGVADLSARFRGSYVHLWGTDATGQIKLLDWKAMPAGTGDVTISFP